jgi:hypothetical protein
MTESLTLAEKNRIYQQRHQARMREKLGDEKYKERKNAYMKEYRDERMKREGYVRPEPVKPIPIAKPAKPPIRVQKEIELPDIKRNKKTTKKQENRIQLLKLNLKSKTLSPRTIKDYVAKHVIMYKLFTGDEESQTMGGWKQEVLRVLEGKDYDDGLHEVISYFKEIKQVVKDLRERYTSDSSFKGMVNAITGLLGRLDDGAYEDEYKYASDIGILLQKEYTEVRDLNELTAEELAKINKIQFDDKSIADNIKKLKDIEEKALYAIYMYIPRRLEISTVRIRFNDKNTTTGNYLILNKNSVPDRFIFNDYKTSKTYHRQIVDIPEQIQPILHEYVLDKNLQTDEVLFSLERSKKEVDDNFSKRLSRVFSKVYGENITNQDLRTAYATYFTTRAKNKTEKNRVANALSHSFEVNEQYVKVNVKKE